MTTDDSDAAFLALRAKVNQLAAENERLGFLHAEVLESNRRLARDLEFYRFNNGRPLNDEYSTLAATILAYPQVRDVLARILENEAL